MDTLIPIGQALAPEIGTTSLSDLAYQTLLCKIVTLEYRPGQLLREELLLQELKVGRTPIREAILRLSGDRLVTVLPRRGTFVSDMNISDLRAIHEIRDPLETLAARLAAERIRESNEDAVRSLRGVIGSLPSQLDHYRLVALDRECHLMVYGLTRNSYMEEDLRRYLNLSIRLVLGAAEQLPAEALIGFHTATLEFGEILEAILARDAQTAQAASAHHSETTLSLLRRLY